MKGFGLGEVSGSKERRKKHDEVENFLCCYSTCFEKGRIFQSFVFSEAADQKLHERDERNNVEDS